MKALHFCFHFSCVKLIRLETALPLTYSEGPRGGSWAAPRTGVARADGACAWNVPALRQLRTSSAGDKASAAPLRASWLHSAK